MAFYSGTDNADDRDAVRFSGVVGKLKDATPQTVWRFNYKDKKIDCDFDDIFAMPTREEQTVPDEWLSKISTPSQTYVYGGNNTKGKADHLREWQYKKPSGPSTVSTGGGNRMGPQLQDQRRLLPDEDRSTILDPYGNYFPSDYGGGFDWANFSFDPSLAHPDDDFGGLTGGHADERFSAAERALANVNEDPAYERAYERALGTDVVDFATGEILRDAASAQLGVFGFSGDDRFEEIEEEHGKDVAEVFCLIDDSMSSLNGKDELVERLMSDMIHMVSEEGQETLIRKLFQELPDKAQERIQMNGIH